MAACEGPLYQAVGKRFLALCTATSSCNALMGVDDAYTARIGCKQSLARECELCGSVRPHVPAALHGGGVGEAITNSMPATAAFRTRNLVVTWGPVNASRCSTI